MDAPGSPSDQQLPAKFARFQALCVDVIVSAGSLWFISLFLARWMVTGFAGLAVLAAAISALQALSILRHGATLGQLLLSLRLADFRTGGPVSTRAAWHWAGMRAVVCLALLGENFPLLFLGSLFYIPMLTDRHQRSLYDDWADVRVVRA